MDKSLHTLAHLLAAALPLMAALPPARACGASSTSAEVRYRVPESGDYEHASYMHLCIHAGPRPQVYVSWHWPDKSAPDDGFPLEPLIATGSAVRSPWGVGAVALPALALEPDGTLRFSDPLRLQSNLEGTRFRLPGKAGPQALGALLQRLQRGEAARPTPLENLREAWAFEMPPKAQITREGIEIDTQSPDQDLPLRYLFDFRLRPLAWAFHANAPRGRWYAELGWAPAGQQLAQLTYVLGTRLDFQYGDAGTVTSQQGAYDKGGKGGQGLTMWRSTQAYDGQGRLTSQELHGRPAGELSDFGFLRRVDIRYRPGAAAAIESLDYNGRTELRMGYTDAGDPLWIVVPGRCVVFITRMAEGNGSYRLSLSERVAPGQDRCLDKEQVTRDGNIYLRPRP